MNIVGLGLGRDGKPLFPAHDETAVIDSLVGALARNAPGMQGVTRTTAETVTFRREAKRAILDAGDPRAAGWTFLVNEADPQRAEVEAILRPLAEHRGMVKPDRPLVYRGESAEEWFDWLHAEYYALALEGGRAPQYVLLVGNPQQIPFGFQSVLATVANVGRLDFDSPDHLETYVSKLLRLERAPAPSVDREALFFATDAGQSDPTHFSRKYMVEPLAQRVRDDLRIATHAILGDAATKPALTAALRARRPALVYTASHGLGALHETLAEQQQVNGAICCQTDDPPKPESLFGADDVPLGEPFLEGSVFFQFACFGYGTPAYSDYSHWLFDLPQEYTEADFVAALPKKLLRHPRGPIAYVGHLDLALIQAFADPEATQMEKRWGERMAPFVRAVEQLLGVQPAGLALQDLSERYSVCNALITGMYDRERRGRLTWTRELKAQLLDRWLTRGDAQNYMVLGDPAARLRMPD